MAAMRASVGVRGGTNAAWTVAIVQRFDAEARGEVGAHDLPGGARGQIVYDPDDPGTLKAGRRSRAHARSSEAFRLDAGLELDGGADLLAELDVRDREADRLADAGVAEQDLVHLARGHFFAATVDAFLEPAGEVEVAVLVDRALVTGAEPAGTERVGVGGFVVPVPGGDVRAANDDLAGGAAGQQLT